MKTIKIISVPLEEEPLAQIASGPLVGWTPTKQETTTNENGETVTVEVPNEKTPEAAIGEYIKAIVDREVANLKLQGAFYELQMAIQKYEATKTATEEGAKLITQVEVN
jgi:hypothetical protein